GEFDAVVACYHDQGLIPVKLLAFGRSVNVTLGLPIIRTSVDHGTAFDIAGKGIADPSSMIEAVLLAARLSKPQGQPSGSWGPVVFSAGPIATVIREPSRIVKVPTGTYASRTKRSTSG